MRRYILTGAPGAGKTTILAGLRDRGYAVVDEAATEVIAREHARGCDEPWREPRFIDAIARLQQQRQLQPVPRGTTVQIFDRSPVCTLALAQQLGHPVTPLLAGQIERILAEQIYQPQVFFVQLLGFITPTAARRITLAESVRFERTHRRAYTERGFELIDVPVSPPEQRTALVEGYLRALDPVSR
ncbi:MAG: AAA family ATPase [Micromonosporaceae bacterium]|nr:AAA family ATPase [Micromonosporaceae bacterium]